MEKGKLAFALKSHSSSTSGVPHDTLSINDPKRL